MSLRSSLFGSAAGLNTTAASKVPRLQELCVGTICKNLFKPDTPLKFDPVVLYSLPESLKPVLIATLRDALSSELLSCVLRYAQFVLRGYREEWYNVSRTQYFREPHGLQLRPCDEPLRLFAFAELLRLSQSVHFDTVFLSIALAATTLERVPMPPALPQLRRLEVREGLYDVSPLLIAAAPHLEWLALEGDDVVRADGSDFLEQVEHQTALRHLEMRNMSCGATPAIVQRAFQRLRSTQLHSLSIRRCDDLPLGSILGFLLKRLESLTRFSLDADNVPTSVFGTMAACDNLTHISLRDCRCVTGSQLVTLAKGAYHMVELDLSRSSVDSKKLHKFATWVAGGLGEQLAALRMISLSELKLSCASVLAVMKCTPSLRVLLLEETQVTMADPKAVNAVVKPKRTVKKKDSNKPKKKGADLNKINKGRRKPKARVDTDELVEAGFSASTITELYMSRSRATDWCAAQILAHCPDLEKLECAALDDDSWAHEDVTGPASIRFNMILAGPKNESHINFKQSNVLAVALFTRRKLRFLNMLGGFSFQHPKWPEFKLMPNAPHWPQLETLLMAHPRRYLTNFAWPSLTKLVLCTNDDVPVVSLLKSLKLVVFYSQTFSPGQRNLWRLRSVPRILFVRCDIVQRHYVPWIADSQDFWSSADTKLKEIAFYDCRVLGPYARDVHDEHVDEALYKAFEERARFDSHEVPDRGPEAPLTVSAYEKRFLKECFVRVRHVFLERKDEFDSVWGETARGSHPQASADDPSALWEFGNYMCHAKIDESWFDMTWNAP